MSQNYCACTAAIYWLRDLDYYETMLITPTMFYNEYQEFLNTFEGNSGDKIYEEMTTKFVYISNLFLKLKDEYYRNVARFYNHLYRCPICTYYYKPNLGNPTEVYVTGIMSFNNILRDKLLKQTITKGREAIEVSELEAVLMS
jgi:hypothetical protein